MTQTRYVAFDLLDDLHDGAPREAHTFIDHVLMIVRSLPRFFSLRDVYRHARAIQRLFPDNTEIEAAIRAALQTLRDAGMIEFLDNRGHYRCLPAAESPHRHAA